MVITAGTLTRTVIRGAVADTLVGSRRALKIRDRLRVFRCVRGQAIAADAGIHQGGLDELLAL